MARTLSAADPRPVATGRGPRCTRLPSGGTGPSRLGPAPGASVVRLVDRPAPGTGLGAARLDELLEPLHVALDSPLDDAERRPDGLDRALGLDVQLERHPALALAQAMERDDAGVVRAFGRRPGDPL